MGRRHRKIYKIGAGDALYVISAPTVYNRLKGYDPGESVILLCIGAGLLVGIWLLKKQWNQKMTRTITEVLPENDYECLLCGYKWRWDSNSRYPTVRVAPDLIAKGELKLKAEAEKEQARRNRDLEWNHWNQWNNPNK